MKEFWTSVASLMGVLAFLQTLLHSLFPPELRFAAAKLLHRLTHAFSSYCYFDITEIDGVNTNELYGAVQLYLSTSASVSSSATRLSLTRALNSSSFTFGLSSAADHLVDSFAGAGATWQHVVVQRQNPQSFSWRPLPDEKRGFTLRIRKQDRSLLLPAYLDHIMESAADLRRRNQDRLLYTNSRGGALSSIDSRGHPWESVPFKHPSTFDTLAMDPHKKREIMDDLRDFAENGKAFYQRTGRAWKRGYLLYGPPGTGKSSMIAAMANYLCYDIYDLELTEVNTNSELRKLLMKTTSKSIIVIEDIDCSVNLTNRHDHGEEKKMKKHPSSGGSGGGRRDDMVTEIGEDGGKSITLSGLLNFTDGLWSCCGSERIFVFTTNHVERLDPALLRSGRMDMHIFMSYCSFPALKILLKNYLGFDSEEVGEEERGLLKELEEEIDAVEMTPADVSEVLIKNRRKEIVEAMKELVGVLKARKEERAGDLSKSKPAKSRPKSEEMEEVVEEEEEQEKRALETSEENGDVVEDCNNGGKDEKLED